MTVAHSKKNRENLSHKKQAHNTQSINEQANSLKESIIDEAKTIYSEGEKQVKAAAEQIKDYTTETTDDMVKSLSAYVKSDPIKALGFAALAGVALALILRK